ncbi:MAG: SOS response-associated peptidase [Sedimentitalea sp.]
MPGRVFLSDPIVAVAHQLGAHIDDVPPQKPRFNIAPGQEVLALERNGLRMMRWGLIPVGRVNARGRPVMGTIINARSETVFDKTAFADVSRAVMPVNGWYEWTGDGPRKTAWRITPKQGGLLYFAGISDVWNAPDGRRLEQLATVTCPPSADLRDIHDRMAVILSLENVPVWLNGTEAEASALMQPWPDDQLLIEKATDVNWRAP